MSTIQRPQLSDYQQGLKPPLPGYRLSKFEVYNWGTFDGSVYSVAPNGETVLLVGENGSGKSTLVDALLTLLVQPKTRNYNVAAGATKNERDERTYIRGAYDRTVGEGGKPQVKYLRSGPGQYSILLATFRNASTNKAFTICQVLYLDSENKVNKVYAFSDSERSIIEDLSHLACGKALLKQLAERGFKATEVYKEYFLWIQRATGFRSKAMDIFNQTVAVKDVQRLDVFIRQHMLERKPWEERIGSLLKHFGELAEAHQLLSRVRLQQELLKPICEEGMKYRQQESQVEELRRLLAAIPVYFARNTLSLLDPCCLEWRREIEHLSREIVRLAKQKESLDQAIARMEIEAESAGGDRLRSLPGLIAQQQQLSRGRKEARMIFESQLHTAGISANITTPEQFRDLAVSISARKQQCEISRDDARQESSKVQFELVSLARRIRDDKEELAAAERQKGNLPESLVSLRENLCHALQIAPTDVPFAAELISVNTADKEWESSIEQVLFGFARSLLVPHHLYEKVSRYLDQTRLVDHKGQGQRLVYLRVPTGRDSSTKANYKSTGNTSTEKQKLISKLSFLPNHPFTSWLREEIERLYNYTACDTIEQFQSNDGPSMTRNRHTKTNASRHEKNDRQSISDRRNYVLGWDNSVRRESLLQSLVKLESEQQLLTTRMKELNIVIDSATRALTAIEQAEKVQDFETIDHAHYDYQLHQLMAEKKALEEADDTVAEIRNRLEQMRQESSGYQADRDQCISRKARMETELTQSEVILERARQSIRQSEAESEDRDIDATLAELEKWITEPLTIFNLGTLPDSTERRFRLEYQGSLDRLEPAARELTSAMLRFLKKFPDEQTDLDADVRSLSSFEAMYERIRQEDLPRHEERFKHRLNEKVLHEIGLLYGSLETERQEILEKISQLNQALKLLEWKSGTFMQLEALDSHDREILDFRREISACLNHALHGSDSIPEASFTRIHQLLTKLQDDSNSRWREKVVDVRNWFTFAAREIVRETGEVRSYYDGGSGQSGGEKGKLAFLVLVAAIAYQYDLNPDADTSDRFHFVVVDEMFSRSDDHHAEYALNLFARFGLQLLIVAPLDAKARVTEPYVGTYLHVVKNKETSRSELLAISAEQIQSQAEIG